MSDNGELERAVEVTSHMIAGCIHYAMAQKRMTVRELKDQITDWDAELLDSILYGNQPERIKCSHLADLAFILDFDWSFQVRPLSRPVTEIMDDKKAACTSWRGTD